MIDDKSRIVAHKRAYDDLVLWIKHQYENEITYLLPTADIEINEWYSLAIKDMIDGASVRIGIKGWFDSETIEFLCNVLGAKRYRVKAYPASRLHIIFKVPISNQAKVAMQCTGQWTPYWRKEDEQERK